jgi:carbamoyltransferase
MNILGLMASDVSGNPATCLLQDGRLTALAEEERFIRVKQAPGCFPSRAVRFCLDQAGLRLDHVQRIAFGWDAEAYRWRFPLFLARSFLRQRLFGARAAAAPAAAGRPLLGAAVLSGIRSLVAFHPRTLTEKIVLGLREAGLDAPRLPPLTFFKHHRAHAASAFYCSGFADSAVLVCDGHGEEDAATLWRGEGRRLELLQKIVIPHSLGWFYSAFTEYLGWRPDEGEVKLMSLAPYGRPDPGLKRLMAEALRLTEDGVRVDAGLLFYGPRSRGRFFSDALEARLGPPRLPGEALTDRHRDIARAVQGRLEEAGLHLARRALRLSGSRRLCLAGGVALNCKLNGRIRRESGAAELFVQPLAHDGGAALGAAQLAALEQGEDCRFAMDHARWGPNYAPTEVEADLRLCRVPYRRVPDPAQEAARLIAEGRIVGWFQGRMECGPRALGGRSILADPRRPDMKDLVNARVKFREPWRPFAVSVQEERLGELVERPAPSPFMTMAFDVLPARCGDLAAALHAADGTTRPQTVSRRADPLFWALIEAFRLLTGVPAVLNTSFNVKDEPLVCSPRDALRCFSATGLDALVLGDLVVEKSS